MSSLIKGGVLGGLIVFLWGSISWMALPWHHRMLQHFTHEPSVQAALLANAPRSGVYIFPQAHGQGLKSPFGFIVLKREGMTPMNFGILREAAIEIFSAFLITGLLLTASIKRYGTRVLFVLMVALTAGVLCHGPEWNWWGFPPSFILLDFTDLLIGWGLAGLVMAKVVQ